MTTKAPALPLGKAGVRWTRPLAVGILVLVGLWLAVYLPAAFSGWTGAHFGYDFASYMRGVDRFLATGNPYNPSDIAGPHTRDGMGFVHPPVSLWLFVPFRFAPMLWWILPLWAMAWCLYRWRPGLLAWAVIAVLMSFPLSIEAVWLGNSSVWMTAAVGLGLLYGWPFALLIVKPTLAFFGLLGIRDKRTWVGAGIALLLCLPFGLAMWQDWIAVVRNLDADPLYNLYSLPMLLVPVVAWLGRVDRDGLVERLEPRDVQVVVGR